MYDDMDSITLSHLRFNDKFQTIVITVEVLDAALQYLSGASRNLGFSGTSESGLRPEDPTVFFTKPGPAFLSGFLGAWELKISCLDSASVTVGDHRKGGFVVVVSRLISPARWTSNRSDGQVLQGCSGLVGDGW